MADRLLAAAVESGRVPGVVALAADREGGVVYEGAFGRRSLDDPAPMTLGTVFWLASLTKAVTTVAAMRLVEAGRLSLDGPLPDGVVPPPLVLEGFAADGSPRLRPASKPVTLRHLLTHTAGYAYPIWDEDVLRFAAWTGLPGTIGGVEDAARLPLVAEPGERWAYGYGTDWAGKVVEAMAGRTLDVHLRDAVLGPLGMADTGMAPAPGAPRAATHARLGDGSLRPLPLGAPAAVPRYFMGGGGLHGTGPDYLRFLRMILGGGRLEGIELLGPGTVAAMAADQLGGSALGPLVTAAPEQSNDVDLCPGVAKGFGLGFLVNREDVPGRRRAGGLAWAGLPNCYYWADPAAGLAGVLLTQVMPFGDPAVLELFAGFERAVYAQG